jgi:hypothetical protein
MSTRTVTPLDRTLSRLCELCPVCRHARDNQKGIAYSFVKHVEVGICPFCQAYERVHGKKAHEAKS